MQMWTKYSYVCTDCDALLEFTTVQDLSNYRGWCACGSPNITRVAIDDAYVPVTNITPTEVVKINTNPYN
jgi:hypothetical protein